MDDAALDSEVYDSSVPRAKSLKQLSWDSVVLASDADRARIDVKFKSPSGFAGNEDKEITPGFGRRDRDFNTSSRSGENGDTIGPVAW